MRRGPAWLFVTLFGVRAAIHHLVGESPQYLNNFEPSALALFGLMTSPSFVGSKPVGPQAFLFENPTSVDARLADQVSLRATSDFRC